jgi:hypothetical protein
MKKLLMPLFIFFMFISVLFAEVPNEIGYHGRLKSYNQPFNGDMLINFKIYDTNEA